MKYLVLLIIVISHSLTWASLRHVGFVTAVEGDVKIFRKPVLKDIPADSITTKLEGYTYKSFAPKLYSKIYEGDLLITGDAAKAKLSMEASDTIMVGSFTKFIVTLARKNKKGANTSNFKLMFGKVRSIVKSKMTQGGKYELTTPSSVIGVRGTDFYTIYRPQNSTTTVSTLEGVVAVKNLTGKVKKEVLVESGYSTSVVNLDNVNIKEFKKVTQITSLETAGLPTPPQTVRAVELQNIKEISTMATSLKKIDTDLSNKEAAENTERKILNLIKIDEKKVDTSSDPLNLNLDALIKKVVNEEKLRQREEGTLNKLDQWIKNY